MTYVIFIINSETIIMIFVYQIRNLLFRYKKEKKKKKSRKDYLPLRRFVRLNYVPILPKV